MNLFSEALAWILDAAHWNGDGSIPQRLAETLQSAGISLLIVAVIAIPVGFAIGHTGRGRSAAILISNIARALPTLGLLSLLVLLMGIGLVPVIVVLVILGIPPMLAGAYAGVESVDRQTIDAARAIGMTEWQIITRVELPLAANLVLGGIRSTALQLIATAVVASYFQSNGLGYFIVQGLSSGNFVEMLAGALLITVLVLILDGLLALVQRLAVPRGVARGRADSAGSQKRTRAPRPRALQEGMQS